MNTIEEIKNLKSLLDQGAISEEEFNQQKNNIVFGKSNHNTVESDPFKGIPISPNRMKGNKSRTLIFSILTIILTSILIVVYLYVFKGGSNKLTDIDNNEYATIQIGDQIWMADNLNVSTFRNGDPIPQVKNADDWDQAGYDDRPAWCYYDNDPNNGGKYGKLYNWYAISDPRGLAPIGWHVASLAEWNALFSFLGGEKVAGDKLKSTSGWNDNGNGKNSSGFEAKPSGFRYFSTTKFVYLGERSWWWSSDERNKYNSYYFSISSYGIDTSQIFAVKCFGCSVRCVKDK